jgi:hypothetical protein
LPIGLAILCCQVWGYNSAYWRNLYANFLPPVGSARWIGFGLCRR